MKNLYIILLLLFAITSCEEVINVDVPTAPPRLVIDAGLELIHDEEKIEHFVKVRLSLTTPFFSEDKNYVNDALVQITDMSTNQVYTLQNSSTFGTYEQTSKQFITNSNGQLVPDPATTVALEFDREYKLSVTYQGNTYEATEELKKSTPINSLRQVKNENDFNPDDVSVEVIYTELPGKGNYYIFDLDEAQFISVDDEFVIDGAPFDFTFTYEEVDTPQELTIRLLGSNKRFNAYIDSLNELSNGGTNGPFSATPFKLIGNIVNTTNNAEFPFGYFRINEVFIDKIDIIANESL